MGGAVAACCRWLTHGQALQLWRCSKPAKTLPLLSERSVQHAGTLASRCSLLTCSLHFLPSCLPADNVEVAKKFEPKYRLVRVRASRGEEG